MVLSVVGDRLCWMSRVFTVIEYLCILDIVE